MYRKYVIAGTRDQFLAWMRTHNAHPRAAVHVEQAHQLRGITPNDGELVYVGQYEQSPVYGSDEHIDFVNRHRTINGGYRPS